MATTYKLHLENEMGLSMSYLIAEYSSSVTVNVAKREAVGKE